MDYEPKPENQYAYSSLPSKFTEQDADLLSETQTDGLSLEKSNERKDADLVSKTTDDLSLEESKALSPKVAGSPPLTKQIQEYLDQLPGSSMNDPTESSNVPPEEISMNHSINMPESDLLNAV